MPDQGLLEEERVTKGDAELWVARGASSVQVNADGDVELFGQCKVRIKRHVPGRQTLV